MNLWGYHPGILESMSQEFEAFLRALPDDDNKSECLLPVVMDRFIAAGVTRCRVLGTGAQWFGLTYQEDKPGVIAALRALHDSGIYPPQLWN